MTAACFKRWEQPRTPEKPFIKTGGYNLVCEGLALFKDSFYTSTERTKGLWCT